MPVADAGPRDTARQREAVAARDLRRLRALLLSRCAGDEGALALLSAPDWAATLSQAAALKRRLECPPALHARVGVPDGGAPAETDARAAAMLRVAAHAWDGAVPADGDVADPAMRAWRRRQKARCAAQLTPANRRGVLHATLSLTLSRGCSVQCWFCSQAAPPLSAVFAHTRANARLWREVLEAAGDVMGPAARTAFCYWDTEPFDNPDYELFACDLHDVLGQFPQTTTARAAADPARTRALLSLSLERDGPRNRFSVLSVPMLRRIYREITPEEMLPAELVLHVPGGNARYSSGRARVDRRAHGALLPSISGTSSCLSGFLVEMPDRTVSLHSPWPADESRPHGTLVSAREHFRDARDLKLIMRRMIAAHMPTSLPDSRAARLRPDVAAAWDGERLTLTSPHARHELRGDASLRTLGTLLEPPGSTPGQLADTLSWHGWSEAKVRDTLDRLFEAGLLDEAAPAG